MEDLLIGWCNVIVFEKAITFQDGNLSEFPYKLPAIVEAYKTKFPQSAERFSIVIPVVILARNYGHSNSLLLRYNKAGDSWTFDLFEPNGLADDAIRDRLFNIFVNQFPDSQSIADMTDFEHKSGVHSWRVALEKEYCPLEGYCSVWAAMIMFLFALLDEDNSVDIQKDIYSTFTLVKNRPPVDEIEMHGDRYVGWTLVKRKRPRSDEIIEKGFNNLAMVFSRNISHLARRVLRHDFLDSYPCCETLGAWWSYDGKQMKTDADGNPLII